MHLLINSYKTAYVQSPSAFSASALAWEKFNVRFSAIFFQILSNEERRSNFDRYGQMDEKQSSGHSHHHGFHGFHNSFYFDESFFHFPR